MSILYLSSKYHHIHLSLFISALIFLESLFLSYPATFLALQIVTMSELQSKAVVQGAESSSSKDEKRKRMLATLSMHDLQAIQGSIKKARALSSEFKAITDSIDLQIEDLAHLKKDNPGISGHCIETFVDKREQLLEDIYELRRQANEFMATEHEVKQNLYRKERTALKKELNELDSVVAKERGILRVSKSKLQLSISSYEGVYDNLGDAYAKCLIDNFPVPSSAQLGIPKNEPWGQENSDQSAFRARMIKRYHPHDMKQKKGGLPKDRASWCPVNKKTLLREMVAAHIVPYTIGEVKAA